MPELYSIIKIPSYRDLEELMQERGYVLGHSTVQRWVVHYSPRIEKAFRNNKK